MKLPSQQDGDGGDGDGGVPDALTTDQETGIFSQEDFGVDYDLEPSEGMNAGDGVGPPLSIIVTGSKDAGKSTGPVGIPRPNDGKTYVITFDDATMQGLSNYYTEEQLEDVEVYEVCRKRYNDEGEVVYPGFDPNHPETGLIVAKATMKKLNDIKQRGDCDVLILDHFQELYSSIAKSAMKHHYGYSPQATNIKMQHWRIRTEIAESIEAKARGIPKFAMVLTGYGGEKELKMKESKGGDTEVVEEVEEPKWVDKFKRPYHVTVDHRTLSRDRASSELEGESEDIYMAEVLTSKHPNFPKGKRIDWTGDNYGIFWETDEFDEIEEVELAEAQDAN